MKFLKFNSYKVCRTCNYTFHLKLNFFNYLII